MPNSERVTQTEYIQDQVTETDVTQDKTLPSKPDVASTVSFLFGWNMELAQFYFRRYQQYCIAPASLLACQSVEDLRAHHAEFLQQMMADYRENAIRLSMIANGRGSEASLHSDYASHLLKAQDDAAAIIEQAKVTASRIVESAEKRAASSKAKSETSVAKKTA